MQVPLAVCVCFSDLLLRMRVLKENNFSTFSTVIWHPHTFFLSTVHLQFPYKILFFPSSGHFFQIRSIKVHRFPHPNHPCQPRQQLDRQRNTTHQTPATAKDDDATAAMADERLVVLQPGQRVNNRWTITRKLGEGAFGAVYLCRDDNGLSAALKTEPLDAKPPLLAMEVRSATHLPCFNQLIPTRNFRPKCSENSTTSGMAVTSPDATSSGGQSRQTTPVARSPTTTS